MLNVGKYTIHGCFLGIVGGLWWVLSSELIFIYTFF